MKNFIGIFVFILAGLSVLSAEEGMMMSDSMMAGAGSSHSGGKVLFAGMDDAMMTAESGPTVLFFAADWCPTCQAALRDLNAHEEMLGDVTVIVVNYDTERDLKKQYGVVYQHTFVQIDPEGQTLSLWNGGGTEGILKHIIRMDM